MVEVVSRCNITKQCLVRFKDSPATCNQWLAEKEPRVVKFLIEEEVRRNVLVIAIQSPATGLWCACDPTHSRLSSQLVDILAASECECKVRAGASPLHPGL